MGTDDFESLKAEFQAISDELRIGRSPQARKILIKAANDVIERACALIDQMHLEVEEMKKKTESL